MVTSNLVGFRLSPQQEQLWRAQGSRPAGGFVCQGILEVRGPLDRHHLRRAVESVVERHEILRTAFRQLPGMSLPVQVVQDRGAVRWSEPAPAAPGEAAVDLLFAEARRTPLSPEEDAALQVALVALGEERHALLLTLPCLAADALSLRILAREIAALHGGAGAESLLPPLQYADAAESLQDWLGPDDGPGAAFWRQQNLALLDPAGSPEPALPETVHRRLPADFVVGLASRLEVPVSLLLLTGWNAALWWETGEERRTIAVAFDGRTVDELSQAVGLYARYLPLQGAAGPGITFGELARSLEGAMTATAPWQDAFSPDRLTRPAGGGLLPLWPVGFDSDRTAALSPAISLRPVFMGLGRFDLRLSVVEEDAAVRLALHYDPSRYSREQAGRLLDRLERLLAGATSPDMAIGEIDVLTAAERRELLVGFNDTATPYPAGATVCDLFEEQVRRTPDAIAVTAAGSASLTFGELDAGANRLARHLRALGTGPESRVGLHLDRRPEMMVALLAVLKAGCAYVPFDLGHPAERLRFLLEDAGLAALVTCARFRPAGTEPLRTILLDPDGADAAAICRRRATAPPRLAGPDNAAYVIYTSGSTGRPKGVVVTHRGLVNYLCWARTAYPAGPGRGAPVHSPLGFDLTVTSVFVPLLAGAPVTLLPEEDGIEALARALGEDGGFSLAKITPAHLGLLRQLTPAGEPPPSAACLVIGGDTLRAADIAPWRQGETRIINEYGPTETVVGCCVHEVGAATPQSGAVPIGRPIGNTRLYVMGPGFRPVPAGVPGELWIGGDGVARGYLGRPDLTAARFVPDPFALPDREGGRLYRTGDLVRLSSLGSRLELECLGRIDDQVKIRGHRIEPGEVAAALATHPGLRDAAVAVSGAEEDRYLVAWVVAHDRARRPAAGELRGFLAERLPAPMIPAVYVHLDILPLTPNGKLDRRALPDPDLHRDAEAPYVPPRTLFEEVLAEIWGQVLGVERVGIDDHFFSLGGDSIRSLQILALAQKRGLALTLQELFQRPTIRGMAEAARRGGAIPAADPDRAPFSLISPDDRQRLAPGIEDAYPVSQLQAGMLFHSEFAPGAAIYHDLHSFRLRAHFDPELLSRAIEQEVLRHPVLRTSFAFAGFHEPLQLVHAEVATPLWLDDLRHLDDAGQNRVIEDFLVEEKHRPFAWERPPLVRFWVHRCGAETFQLTLSFHHAILDGWSVASLLTSLFRRYSALLGHIPPLEDRPVLPAFRELVALERSVFEAPAAREFWTRHLEGAELSRLPRWGAAAPGGDAVAGLPVPLAPEISEGLWRLARLAAVPLKSILLAAHFHVLGYLAGTPDVVAGVVSHGRPEMEGAEEALGLFLNTLPLRLQLAGGTWTELVQAVFDLEREALPFRRFPLSELQRLRGGAPLFEVIFNFIRYHVYLETEGVPGIEVLERAGYEETNFPLVLYFSLEPGGSQVGLFLSYARADFAACEVEALAGRYRAALTAMAAAPQARSDAALLTGAERHQILTEWNDAAAGISGKSVLAMLTDQVARNPDAVAASSPEGRLTYSELAQRADSLAWTLRNAGAGPEVIVALLAPRSLDYLTALLATWKAGAAHLPLDPAHPAQRQAQILERSRAGLALCAPDLAGRLDEAVVLLPETRRPRKLTLGIQALASPVAPLPAPEVHGLAYVIFTSGSTGTPKGAMVEARGMLNHLLAKTIGLELTAADVVAQNASQSFDISIWQFMAALLVGGRVHVVPDEIAHDPSRLLDEVANEGVTVLEVIPSLLAVLLDEATLREAGPPELPVLRWLIATGEALPPDLCRRWLSCYPGVPLLNAYGPTECSDDVTHHVLAEPPGPELRVPIGRPVLNLRLYTVDRSLSPLPACVASELCVGGIAVGRGYLGEAARTAEVFIPDPFAGEPGSRLYRTGDLVRLLPGGAIEFLGRLDQQVKIRGFRVELGEVESALAAHPAVRQAAVVTTPAGALAAFVVARAGQAVEPADLQRFLATTLPAYMVPMVIVPLAAMPLTANGKLDRRALAIPEGVEPASVPCFAAPRTPVEEILAGIWADVLGRPDVGVHDNFFDLGGHSLLATRVVSWIRNTLRVDLPLRALFDTPTVTGLAVGVEAALRAGDGPAEPPIEPRPRGLSGEDLPLSFAQQRLWFLDQLVPGNPFYNIRANVRVQGELDVAALMASLSGVVRRHEALRTTFPVVSGHPIQLVAPPTPVPMPIADLSGIAPGRREEEVERLAAEEAGRPFDLARGPLLRTALLRATGKDHLLLATFHHIISDGWSSGVLRRDLAALYEAFSAGRPSPLPELPVQYADFSVWQRRWLQSEVLDAQLAWWKERLDDPPVLDLPVDRPRPALGTFRGGDRRLHFPLSGALSALGRRRGATLFMVLLALWETLLYRYTGQTDLLVGTPIANRNRAEIEELIGFFVNTLALRGDLSGNPAFLELVDRLREVTLGAYAHQDLPFEKLVEELHPERDTSRNPLFQVVFVLQNFPTPAVRLPTLTLAPVDVAHGTAKFDLTLLVEEDRGEALVVLEYSADLFDPPTLERMLAHFQTLATSVLADPERPISTLPLLDEAERHQILREWAGAPDLPAPQGTLHERFARQAARTPGAPAVTCEGEVLTYGELDRRAGRLARRLAALGVGPEVPVALCLERSPALAVGILGTLRAGGAYVPLDPAYPRERLAWTLADCRAAVVVSERPLAGRLQEPLPPVIFLDEEGPEGDREAQPTAAGPGNTAYVIYTSGSTGRPKGVQITHANVLHLFDGTQPRFRFGAEDVWTLFHSYAFDFSVWELWGALLNGGRLAIVPWEVSRSPEAFHALLRREKVTVLSQTPAAFRQLARADAASDAPLPDLRLVVFGGEALDIPALAPWIERYGDRRPLLVNMYGITETTVHVTWRPVATADLRPLPGSPIGVPIPGLRAHVLDTFLQPVPAGVPGEICVSGGGLARGYLGRPELTAERFIPDPFQAEPGARLYRSGDLARQRPDGELEHLGRIDQQVKVRGFRIEPGEIEAALTAHPAVQDAAVLLYGGTTDEAGGPRLVAYVVPDPAARPASAPGGEGSSEQVERWRVVFDDTYGEAPEEADPTFDITGWNSSYTGQPIPAEEMREWVDGTVQRLLAERPSRVLEIGCGTGLLLFRLAQHAAVYRGTDFSAAALAKLRRRLAGRGLDHVELERRAADDFSGIEPGRFDAIVVNSVAQYFPGVDYLVAVIEGALRALAPDGVLFLGDLRSLPLLSAFHTAVELHQAGNAVPRAHLRQRVRRSLAREEELALDPGLFAALAQRLGAVQVDLQLRRGRRLNEMSRFRYDAVLRRRPDAEPATVVERSSWDETGLSLGLLREHLEQAAPEEMEITGVLNARVAAEVAILDLLDAAEGPETADGLRRIAAGHSAAALDPEDLWDLGRDLSYDVAIGWSAAGADRMDVRLTRRGPGGAVRRSFPAARPTAAPGLSENDFSWSSWANDPAAGRRMRGLVPSLRDFLQGRLPEHMIPTDFILLEALPLTPNGKLSRRALPPPDLSRGEGRREHTPPHGPVEAALAGIWSEVLGIERVGADDGFFELGGHSLLATQVVARVRNAFGIELPLRALFEEPTLAGLAGRIDAARRANERSTIPPPAPRTPEDRTLPFSFAQQQLWLLDEREPGRPDYNIVEPIRLSGALDTAALFAALREVVRRHEVLRTTFAVVDGRPVQVIGALPEGDPPTSDLSGLPAACLREEAERLTFAEAHRPFDLARGPLLRLLLIRLGPEEHVVLLTLHHIVADGWSVGVLIREATALYGAFARRAPSPLPELPIQYADYALWQRRWLEGEPLEGQLAYWRRQLAGLPLLRLPTDRPRPPVRRGRGRQLPFAAALPPIQAVRALAEAEGATLFMLLLAAFTALLAREAGQDDVVVGTDVANRNRRETEDLIGFFINQLVLRVDVSGDPTFRELLGRAREVSLAAYAHQDVPFERLVAAVQPDRDLSRTPLFQLKIVLQNAPAAHLTLPGLKVAPVPVSSSTAKFDLLIDVLETGDGLFGEAQYDVDLFDATTIDRLTERFAGLLREAVARPDARLSDLLGDLDVEERSTAAGREHDIKESRLRRLRQIERRPARRAAAADGNGELEEERPR